MSAKERKPLKKREMIALYIMGVVGQLLTIIMWFFPTLKGTYFTTLSLLGEAPKLEVTLFSYSDSLPAGTNYLNIAILLLSVVSLVLMAIPLIRKTVMKPRMMICPVVLNLVYLLLFLVRYINAVNTYPLYDVVNTPVSVLYFLGIVAAFSAALSVLVYYPRLKKQAAPDETV